MDSLLTDERLSSDPLESRQGDSDSGRLMARPDTETAQRSVMVWGAPVATPQASAVPPSMEQGLSSRDVFPIPSRRPRPPAGRQKEAAQAQVKGAVPMDTDRAPVRGSLRTVESQQASSTTSTTSGSAPNESAYQRLYTDEKLGPDPVRLTLAEASARSLERRKAALIAIREQAKVNGVLDLATAHRPEQPINTMTEVQEAMRELVGGQARQISAIGTVLLLVKGLPGLSSTEAMGYSKYLSGIKRLEDIPRQLVATSQTVSAVNPKAMSRRTASKYHVPREQRWRPGPGVIEGTSSAPMALLTEPVSIPQRSLTWQGLGVQGCKARVIAPLRMSASTAKAIRKIASSTVRGEYLTGARADKARHVIGRQISSSAVNIPMGLQVAREPKIGGYGVFATEKISVYTWVLIYSGEVKLVADIKEQSTEYIFEYLGRYSDFCVDAREYGNIARFINHSSKTGSEPRDLGRANLIPYYCTHQGLPYVVFQARLTIRAGDQLLYDYGTSYNWSSQTLGTSTDATQSAPADAEREVALRLPLKKRRKTSRD